MAVRKKKSETDEKLEASYSADLKEVIDFNSKILTEILHKLEALDKRLKRVIHIEKKLKRLKDEVSIFQDIYVQDHTPDNDRNDADNKQIVWN